MTTTMKDIAIRLGVSVNTVSHALKNKPDISRKLTKKIQQTAAELGYRPNLTARNLVLRKSSTIGLGVTEINNPVRVEFCERLRSLAYADGYRLLTISLDHDFRKCMEDFPGGNVDGIILGALWNLPEEMQINSFIEECRRNQLPVVVFGEPAFYAADGVEIDLRASVRTLTGHLLKRGYLDIALFASKNSEANFQGYAQAMEEAGLKRKIRRIELSSSRMETAYTEMNSFIDSGKRLPRAVIAANDLAAFGVIRSLHEHGIAIPEQCAVAGVDNTEFGNYSTPSLTSIGFDYGQCAEAVWKLMMRRLNKQEKRPVARTALRQKLFVRKST